MWIVQLELNLAIPIFIKEYQTDTNLFLSNKYQTDTDFKEMTTYHEELNISGIIMVKIGLNSHPATTTHPTPTTHHKLFYQFQAQ